MILKVVSTKQEQLKNIAKFLIKKKLIATAVIGQSCFIPHKNQENSLDEDVCYTLSGISKSLLFKKINDALRAEYGSETPLIYSEPIIMIDPEQTDEMLGRLIKT